MIPRAPGVAFHASHLTSRKLSRPEPSSTTVSQSNPDDDMRHSIGFLFVKGAVVRLHCLYHANEILCKVRVRLAYA
jgi:hypothetical protein